MLDIGIDTKKSLDQGAYVEIQVEIEWKDGIKRYTESDYLDKNGVSDISSGVSREGGYQAPNCSVVFKNLNYHFSKFFEYEMPNGKLMVVYAIINGEETEITRGKINSNWKLTKETLTLSIS